MRFVLATQARDHPRERIERLDRRHPLDLERAQLFDHAALGWRKQTDLRGRAAALSAVREPRQAGFIEFIALQIIENLARAR